ncbi:hypothetical protein ANRL1_02240 [Anaerolineae bacterium]|nr:hypothetical protein ANRL1_02240 [Anaerolineae bacterium]
MDRLLRSKWFSPAFIITAALFTAMIYSNSFRGAFQFDDLPIIAENTQLRDLGNIPQLLTGQRGLTMATFAVNYAISGIDTAGYHAVNLFIHVINTAFAYLLILYTLKLTGSAEASARRLAALVALLFAAHPVQTQAVTYIVQRMESLTSLFYLLALLFLVWSSRASTAARRAALYAGVALSYLLAFYSKEIAYTLPAVVLLYDFCFIAKGKASGVGRRWPMYAMLAFLFTAFTVTTVMPLGGFGDVSDESADAKYAAPKVKANLGTRELDYSAGFKVKSVSSKDYLYTQFNVMTYYMGLLAFPAVQNLDYDFPWSRELMKAPTVAEGTVLNTPIPAPFVSLVILLAIAAAGAYMIISTQKAPESRKRVAGFFIFWYFIILSPTSSIVPIIDAIYEHRVYLPSLGFFAIFVMAVDALAGRVFKKKKTPLPATGKDARPL